MTKLTEIFSNRELSTIFWLIIIIIIVSLTVGKKSIADLLKSFFVTQIISVLVAMLVYIALVILILYKINFWNIGLLKDTIIWSLSTGFILFMNVNKAKNLKYFKDILLENFKAILILEFITNFYTFSLTTEMFLIPIMSFIILLKLFAENSAKTNSEHIKVAKLLNNIVNIFGLFVFCFVVYKTFFEYSELLKITNLKSFLFPILLSILTLPFYYLLALYMNYETLFVRIQFMFVDKKIKRKLKKAILISANISLNKLEKINLKLNKVEIYNNENIKKYIKHISK